MTQEVVILALSGRALAAAARRAGYDPIVLDLFGDLDTRDLAKDFRVLPGSIEAGFEPEALVAAVNEFPGIPIVYGTGFEHCPSLLKELAAGRRLTGNLPDLVWRVKTPARFFGLLDGLGIPHPQISLEKPENPEAWLAKRAGGAGGWHVRPAADTLPSDTNYYQQRLDGEEISAQFLADGRHVQIIGFSRQWRAPGQGFSFGGLVRPAAVGERAAAKIEKSLSFLLQFCPLRGLQNADFLVKKADFWLLEVNPRPGIALDCFDSDPNQPLFAAHLRACDGILPESAPILQGAQACNIVFAARAMTVPEGVAWPDWVADRPAGGSSIPAGAPICTTLARAEDAAAAERLVKRRAETVRAGLEAGRTQFDEQAAA